MHIKVVCTRCEARFNVDEGLLGKRIRCPTCRGIFEARTEADNAPPQAPPETVKPEPPAAAMSGSVTDLVPLLSAEIADPSPEVPVAKKQPEPPRPPRPAQAKEPPARSAALAPAPEPPGVAPPPVAPPPVRVAPALKPTAAPPADFPDDFPGDDMVDGTPAAGDSPQEVGPGTWEAPPVRSAQADSAGGVAVIESPPTAVAEPPAPGRTARRRSLHALAVLALVGMGVFAGGWWYFASTRAGNEADRARHAQELYAAEDYQEAADAFQKLTRDFPGSADAAKFRFMAELSSVRGEADEARESTALKSALDNVVQFLAFNEQDPLLKDRRGDVWKALHLLARRLAAEADKERDSDALEWARSAWDTAKKKLEPPAQVNLPEEDRLLNEKFASVRKNLATHAQRQAVLGALAQWIARPGAAGIQEARMLVASAGFKDDPEIGALLTDLVHAHRGSIKYFPAPFSLAVQPSKDDMLPGLLVMPARTLAKARGGNHGVVFALVRGVLYALDAERGELRWARRVGIDTTLLPLRVPADPITPEVVLVLSSDNLTVTAMVADNGTVVWQHHLEQPCTGQPALVGRSLLVPTLAGRVDEVEIRGGRLLGHYALGQRLTAGAAAQDGTSLVYIPGDAFCVYVLDVAKHTCEAVLYTQHPAGSLRGVPILLPARKAASRDGEPAKGPASWMLLCQAKGTSSVEVRPFELPIRDPDQPPAEPVLHVPGMSWFAPYHDREKLALATDAGRLALWGIRLKGNRDDPLLFSLLGDDYLVGSGAGRAQVVHADVDSYWTLTGGRLHRLKTVFRPQSGPNLLPVWPQPPVLGSPLHAAQHQRDSAGRATLFLTTLDLGRPTCRCTAVDAASGHVNWDRQLGCTPLAAPVVLNGRVLLRDAHGFVLLDPAEYPEQERTEWRTIDDFLVADPLAADVRVLLRPAGKEVVQLTWSKQPGKTKLRLRHVTHTGAGATETHDLPAPLAGSPVVGDGFALLPLANGVAVRIAFGGTLTAGPNWRGVGVDEQAIGHIVALGNDEFVLTDGGRSLARVSWPGKTYQQHASAELGHRITTRPAVLATGNSRPRIAVADASDLVTLLDGDRLETLRRWPMPGKITAGPFVRGKTFVCIVDRKRLMWLDPEREDPQEYAMVADIVGAPVLVEGMLVAADTSGRFVAFDAQTGSPLGPGFTLRADAAPETAPVPFGPGRLLVPLNDGTIVLLPLAKLR
jgi:hypothetical protein